MTIFVPQNLRKLNKFNLVQLLIYNTICTWRSEKERREKKGKIMNKFLATFLALLIFTSPVLAKVQSQQIPDVLIEGTILTLKDNNLNSKTNPLKVQVITIDGTVTELTPFLDKKGKQAKVLLPLIPDVVGSIAQVTIRISGGAIPANDPADFPRILTKQPAGFQPDPIDGNIASSQTSIPANSGIGVILEGPAGPQGAAGPAGAPGAQGANGAPGPTGPIPVTYPGANIVGDVASAVVFTGNLAGDVTGPMSTTAIANSVVTGKQLNGGYTAAAGVVADGDSIQTAIAKLDGTLQANDADNAAIHVTLGTPTSSNTANEIVERDASGNFSANVITANSFVGPLTGNVTGDLTGNVTGNVTGDVSGDLTGQVLTATQSSITNLPALANVGTATTFAGTVTAPSFSGPLSGAVTGNVNGNLTGQVQTASQPSITTLAGLTNAGTAGINTTFAGPVVAPQGFDGNLTGTVLTATQNSITTMTGLTNVGTAGIQTQFQGPVKGNQGFIGDITGNLTGNVNGNVNGNATNATNAANVTVGSQPAITSLAGLTNAGTPGNTINLLGSLNVLQNASVTGALSAGSLSSSGTITAPKFVGNLQGTVLTPAQPQITTLAGLTAAGTGGVTTTFAGPVAAPQGFTGNLTGNVTGNADTATNATNAANVTGSSQVAITDLPALATVGTSTTFTGQVTATQFNGPLNGNANSATTAGFATAAASATTAISAATAAALDDSTNTLALAGAGGILTLTIATGPSAVTMPASGTLATTTGLTPIAVGADVNVNSLAVAAELVADDVKNFVKVGTTGASTVTTIDGGTVGQRLTIVFTTGITVTDNNAGTAKTINLAGTGDYSAAVNDVLELIYDGTSWFEVSRSVNN